MPAERRACVCSVLALAAVAQAADFRTTGALTEGVGDPVQIVFLVTGGDQRRVASAEHLARHLRRPGEALRDSRCERRGGTLPLRPCLRPLPPRRTFFERRAPVGGVRSGALAEARPGDAKRGRRSAEKKFTPSRKSAGSASKVAECGSAWTPR